MCLTSSLPFCSPVNLLRLSLNWCALFVFAAIVCQVEALQREVCVRNTHWQQQKQREEDILSDLDSALYQCLFRVTEVNSYRVSKILLFFVCCFYFVFQNILNNMVSMYRRNSKGFQPFEHVEGVRSYLNTGANCIGEYFYRIYSFTLLASKLVVRFFVCATKN